MPGGRSSMATSCATRARTALRTRYDRRQARRARLGVPLGTLRVAGADLHPNGASSAHGAPLPLRGSEGARPPASPSGGRTECGHGGYAAPRPNRRPTSPSPTCPRAVAGRRRCGGGAPPRALRGTRSTGLAKRGRRRNGGPRCRAVHVPAKPERRLIPASAPGGGHGHQLRRVINQPDLRVSSRVSPCLVVLPFHASVTRRAASYGFDSAMGFILAGRARESEARL